MIRSCMHARFGLAAAALAATLPWSTPAFGERHALAVKVGLLGVGIEYAYSPVERWAVRFGLNGAQTGFEAEESGIDYDVNHVFDSAVLAVDFYPSGDRVRVSAGMLHNDNRLDVESRSRGTIDIGGNVYDADEIGVLSGRVDFDDRAPFVGVGWDASRRPGRRVGWAVDIGVLRQGDPRVELAASGPITALPGFAADLAREEAELADSLDRYDLLPFATFAVVIRF